MVKQCDNLHFWNAARTVYKLFRISREREPSLGSGGVREYFDYHLELDNSNERVKDAFLKFVLPFYKGIYWLQTKGNSNSRDNLMTLILQQMY